MIPPDSYTFCEMLTSAGVPSEEGSGRACHASSEIDTSFSATLSLKLCQTLFPEICGKNSKFRCRLSLIEFIKPLYYLRIQSFSICYSSNHGHWKPYSTQRMYVLFPTNNNEIPVLRRSNCLRGLKWPKLKPCMEIPQHWAKINA